MAKRSRDGSAFTRCEACNKDVPVVLIDMHSCSLDAKIRMTLEAQVVEKTVEVTKTDRKKPAKAGAGAGAANKDSKRKRTPTAFFLFMADFRKDFKAAHPDNKSVSTVAKEGGERWNSMTDEEKKPYIDKAAELKALAENGEGSCGCDASILLDQSNSNPQPEKLAIPLRGYDAVNTIKAAVESVCPGVVSCADILAYAARDSAMVSGGFTFPMPGGRRDGFVSDLNDIPANIPSPSMQAQDLIKSFVAAKGLSTDDLVALSGAHSFGQTHCSVTPRLYPSLDKTMDKAFGDALQGVCPRRGGGGTVLDNNRVTDPNVLSNRYYKNVIAGKVMFTSDQTLASDAATKDMVKDNAASSVAWMARFAAAMVKMGGVEVLTGSQGEVRSFCGATNSGS